MVALDILVGLGELHLLRLNQCGITLLLGEELGHIAHGLREVRLGLRQRHFGVARIELHQHLALVHELRLVGVDGDHRAGNLRSEPHQVAIDIGIVGGHVTAHEHQVVNAPAEEGEERYAEQDERTAARAFLRRRCRGLSRVR